MAFVKECSVTVRSVITHLTSAGIPEGEAEVSELTLPAVLKATEGGVAFTYTESGEGGKTVCHIEASDTAVCVSRRGASVCDMHFGDADDEGIYEVPPYRFPFTIHTKKIRYSLTPNGGRLDILYRMTLGGDLRDTHMRITLS